MCRTILARNMGQGTSGSKRKELSEYDPDPGKNRKILWRRSTKIQKAKQNVDGREESDKASAIAAEISRGLLCSWGRCYKMKGYID